MLKLDSIVTEDSEVIANNNSIPWHKLRNKTVLITGANGYVPSYFVYGLMKRNELYGDEIRVVALCRSKERALKKFACYKNNKNFELIIQNVVDPIEYDQDINYFIHAASPAGYFSRHFKPADTFNANIIGCQNLLELSRKKSVEGFLLLSSVDIYGRNAQVERLTEADYGYLDPVNPRNSYTSSKLAAEGLSLSYFAQYGTPVRIVRPFQILGNGLALDDGRLHVDFISQLISKKSITLKGDGTPLRTFMYATDATIGMLQVLLKGLSGEAYNVCHESGEASVLELAELMLSLLPDGQGVTYDKTQRNSVSVKDAVPIVLGDSTKIRELGFSPTVELKEGVLRIMQAYGLNTI